MYYSEVSNPALIVRCKGLQRYDTDVDIVAPRNNNRVRIVYEERLNCRIVLIEGYNAFLNSNQCHRLSLRCPLIVHALASLCRHAFRREQLPMCNGQHRLPDDSLLHMGRPVQ